MKLRLRSLESKQTIKIELPNPSSMLQQLKKYFEHYFERRVLREELGGGDGSDHKLMVIAIHAILLESSFVGFDSVSSMQVDGFHLPNVWPSKAFYLFVMRKRGSLGGQQAPGSCPYCRGKVQAIDVERQWNFCFLSICFKIKRKYFVYFVFQALGIVLLVLLLLLQLPLP